MKRVKTNRIAIDAHAHLDKCRVFDLDVSEEKLIGAMDSNRISASIVQPFPGAYPQPPNHIHDKIARIGKKYAGRIFGLISMNPHMVAPNEYRRLAKKYVKEHGFVGIKLHTIGHAVNPLSKDGELVFKTANELEVPLMVHTGLGLPFASPSRVADYAKHYPDLKIILAHGGFIFSTPEAIAVALQFENVYIETSWCVSDDIKYAIDKLGHKRVMFGGDLPGNVSVELCKVNSMNLKEEDKEWFLHKTAEQVFNISVI